MDNKENDGKNISGETIYDYGDRFGSIECLNISESFDEPLLLAAACFHPSTLIKMKDGSSKKIKDILIGDEIYQGGRVYMKMEALSDDMYEINGIKVAGEHTIYENGQWVQVRDSSRARHCKGTYAIVNIGTDEHMIVTETGEILADYYVTNKHIEIDRQLVELINEEKDERFMRERFELAY